MTADEIARSLTDADLRAISSALVNARYALEFWQREALVGAPCEKWINDPLRRGQVEIKNLKRLDDIVRPLAYPQEQNHDHPLAR